mmetsp:Transcript_37193/g.109725  ORF Transcript_37193/g.109725 Transcript_37193/m.109725 type:complete len:325 (+) Transcript_37193:428-1402(+)
MTKRQRKRGQEEVVPPEVVHVHLKVGVHEVILHARHDVIHLAHRVLPPLKPPAVGVVRLGLDRGHGVGIRQQCVPSGCCLEKPLAARADDRCAAAAVAVTAAAAAAVRGGARVRDGGRGIGARARRRRASVHRALDPHLLVELHDRTERSVEVAHHLDRPTLWEYKHGQDLHDEHAEHNAARADARKVERRRALLQRTAVEREEEGNCQEPRAVLKLQGDRHVGHCQSAQPAQHGGQRVACGKVVDAQHNKVVRQPAEHAADARAACPLERRDGHTPNQRHVHDDGRDGAEAHAHAVLGHVGLRQARWHQHRTRAQRADTHRDA